MVRYGIYTNKMMLPPGLASRLYVAWATAGTQPQVFTGDWRVLPEPSGGSWVSTLGSDQETQGQDVASGLSAPQGALKTSMSVTAHALLGSQGKKAGHSTNHLSQKVKNHLPYKIL